MFVVLQLRRPLLDRKPHKRERCRWAANSTEYLSLAPGPAVVKIGLAQQRALHSIPRRARYKGRLEFGKYLARIVG